MIRHMVLVQFRDDVAPEGIATVFAELDALRSLVPGMLRFSAGANVSPEGLARGFGHAFIADFADAAARDAYLVHPAHQAAGARLVSLADAGIDGLIVIDIESA